MDGANYMGVSIRPYLKTEFILVVLRQGTEPYSLVPFRGHRDAKALLFQRPIKFDPNNLLAPNCSNLLNVFGPLTNLKIPLHQEQSEQKHSLCRL